MKKLLLLTLLALSAFAQAQSQSLPWADQWAMPIVLKDTGKFQMPVYNYVLLQSAFNEVEGFIEEIQGKPAGTVKISPEYIEYRFGDQVIYRNTIYVSVPNAAYVLPEEVKVAFQLSKEGKLKKEDLKGPNWIHMIQAIDVEEVNCLAISRKNGKSSGCADIWQEGLTEDETVCFKGRTYLKCHVNCLEKIYKRTIEATPGSCAEEVANEN